MITPVRLARLSVLLDTALDLPESERDSWLGHLKGDDAALGTTLRELLVRHAAKETADLLERPPAFTVTGAASDVSELRDGDSVGAYRLERLLGRGGMGEVWLAERIDGTLKRKVALKLPHVTWAPGPAERFALEREILSALEHPNIARLYDAGVDAQGRPYMALEFVEGQPLDEYCNSRALSIEARLKLLLQVAEALAFAHSRLVVHRDLKPGNILVTGDGQVRLLDFGIAKLLDGGTGQETALTKAGGRALTLDYASPEQIRGEPIGTASDVYSLGVVAFELLAGARPYRLKRESAAALEQAITSDDLPLASAVADDQARRKSLRGDLDAILNTALKRRVGERYATIDALAQDWRRYLDGRRVLARPDTLVYRLSRLAARYRVPLLVAAIAAIAFALAIGFGATAVVILALLAGLGAAMWQARRASEQARIARVESKTAESVKRFLLDIFETSGHGQSDPRKAQQTTARELLDIGVQRISRALHNEPEARIAVLLTLSEMYYQIGLRADSAQLSREVVGLARETFGRRDVRFAQIAMDRISELHDSAQRHEIPGLLAEAKVALADSRQPDSLQRGTLFYHLANFECYESLAGALQTSEHALRILQRTSVGYFLSDAFRLAGRIRIVSGHFDVAENHNRHAVAVPLGPDEGSDAFRVNARAELAESLLKLGRLEESERYARMAAEQSSRVNGAEHRWTLIHRIRLANQLTLAGKVEEALGLRADVEKALEMSRPEYDAQFRAYMSCYLHVMLKERGRPDLCAPLLLEDLRDRRQHVPRSGSVAEREVELANVYTACGRYDEAQVLIDGAKLRWERYAGGAATPARNNPYLLAAARLQLARGLPEEAQRCLSQLATPATAAHGRFDDRIVDAAAERALVALALGEAGAARELANVDMDALDKQFGSARMPHLRARLHLVRGRAQQVLGNLREAEADLRIALTIRRRHDDAASLWLAEVQIALAHCMSAMNSREEAQALRQEARQIHAQHQDLGAHLVRPLTALEKLLA